MIKLFITGVTVPSKNNRLLTYVKDERVFVHVTFNVGEITRDRRIKKGF